MYVTELFPELPESFHSGSMVIDIVSSVSWPMNFSVLALYTAGQTVFTASATDMEEPAVYVFLLPNTEPDSVLEALQSQYHFEVMHHTPGYQAASIRTTREVARVMAKDPRVTAMSLNAFVVL
jgi:hypothetical protein